MADQLTLFKPRGADYAPHLTSSPLGFKKLSTPLWWVSVSFQFFLYFYFLGSGERERDDLRDERHRDRARQRNIDRAAPERRSKLERGRERDVSEQIALGIPAKTAGASGEGLFDSRLFNQSRGLSSGIFFLKK